MSSTEIESILREVLIRRKSGGSSYDITTTTTTTNQLTCSVCRKEASYCRVGDTVIEKLFCNNKCSDAEHYTSHTLQLGMKRGRGLITIEEGERWNFDDFPEDVQAHIILLVFDYRIEGVRDWDELMKLKHLIDKRRMALVDNQVIPNLHYVASYVLEKMDPFYIQKLVHLHKIDIPTKILQVDWNTLLNPMDMVDLDISGNTDVDIRLGRLTGLTRLTCNSLTEDVDIENLTNLTALGVRGSSSKLTDQCLSQLRRLEMVFISGYSSFDTMIKFDITSKELQKLPNLQLLSLAYVKSGVISNDYVKDLTSLTGLSLYDTGVNDITTLVNIQFLRLEFNNIEGRLSPQLTKLILKHVHNFQFTTLKEVPKLMDLSVQNSYASSRKDDIVETCQFLTNLQNLELEDDSIITNECLPFLTSLRSLSLKWNRLITHSGVSHLTNLTSIDLSNNDEITSDSLKDLAKLERIRESHKRVYGRTEGGEFILL